MLRVRVSNHAERHGHSHGAPLLGDTIVSACEDVYVACFTCLLEVNEMAAQDKLNV